MAATPGADPLHAPARPPGAPLLFVVSGPSGAGKDSVVDGLKARGAPCHYAITATTRAPRGSEVDGVHYHFRTTDAFRQMIDAGELLEWAQVYENFYGTPKFELREAAQRGQDVVVKVDVQGAASIKRALPQAILMFIAPGSVESLAERLGGRQTDTEHQRTVRLNAARAEMQAVDWFDYVIVNRDGRLDEAVAGAEAVLTAEKLRVHPRVFTLA
jgi:guanylate kinase